MCRRLALNTAMLYYPFKYSYLYIDLVLDNSVLDSTAMPYSSGGGEEEEEKKKRKERKKKKEEKNDIVMTSRCGWMTE